MPIAKVDDINIYYEIHGRGDPLLLIVGLGGNITGWAFQIPKLSQDHQVIVFDNRGAGRSDIPDMPYSIQRMAQDAAGLLATLKVGSAHVLGVSMGGYIAQELALDCPERVSSLILANTAAKQTSVARHVFKTQLVAAREGISAEVRIRALLPWLFSTGLLADPKRVQTMVSGMLRAPYPQPEHGLSRQLRACREHDSRKRLAQIMAPTLVLAGGEDTLYPVRTAQELAAAIPKAELVVLDGAGHASLVETPDKFNQAVLDFLAKVKSVRR